MVQIWLISPHIIVLMTKIGISLAEDIEIIDQTFKFIQNVNLIKALQ